MPSPSPRMPWPWGNQGLVNENVWDSELKDIENYKMTSNQDPRPKEQTIPFPENRPEAAAKLPDGKLMTLCGL